MFQSRALAPQQQAVDWKSSAFARSVVQRTDHVARMCCRHLMRPEGVGDVRQRPLCALSLCPRCMDELMPIAWKTKLLDEPVRHQIRILWTNPGLKMEVETNKNGDINYEKWKMAEI
ncbi:Protein of unknown function [Gryllus bimaculatus]|nr:Protein of unknown function [Gryllus bimaculatus]